MTSFETSISTTETAETIASQAVMFEITMTALRLSKESTNYFGKEQNQTTQRRQFTLKEVAEHSSPDNCWIIIYDRVYDITRFLDLHPGGSELLLEYVGHDATLAFRGTGHSNAALQMLKEYEIGELVASERIFRGINNFNLKGMPE